MSKSDLQNNNYSSTKRGRVRRASGGGANVLSIKGIRVNSWNVNRERLKMKAVTPGISEAGAKVVLEAMKAEAPVKTGRLRDSHTMVREGNIYIIRARTRYAAFVHYGTKYMRRNLWMQKAIYKSKGRIASMMRNTAERRIA